MRAHGAAPWTSWLVRGVRHLPELLRCLGCLFPDGSVLYLESAFMVEDVQAFLEPRRVPAVRPVSRGTVWPRPKRFHMVLSRENLEGLAAVAERHAWVEVCEHLLVYNEDCVLLEGYDAPLGLFYVSGRVAEEKVRDLCARLGCKYERTTGPRRLP